MAQNTSVSSFEIMDLMWTKRINNFEGDQDKEYNANMQIENYDQKRGNLSWIGRRVRKIFAGRGEFEGIVYAADDERSTKAIGSSSYTISKIQTTASTCGQKNLSGLLYRYFACVFFL